ncbi:hypothetical protein ACLESD_16525 [Pyxidicoccus sp. 3LFB2]
MTVACCGPYGLIQWRLTDGKDFCRTLTVGEPLGAVLSRADQSGLFNPLREPGTPGPGTRYLIRPLAPFCDFVCFVDHDGARVTAHGGSMGGLCN